MRVLPKIRFFRNEEGGLTLLGLYLAGAMLILGGIAADVANLIAARTQLQVAADFASHAALYRRQFVSAAAAKQDALNLVKGAFPQSRFGDMLSTSDIHFGHYNPVTNGFQIDSNSMEAAMVKTDRLSSQGNAVAGYLTKMIGYSEWNVVSSAVFETFRPHCLRDGWVGEDVVDAQSNNTFVNGFCIHSNTQVEFNSGSFYEAGVTVSAPDGFGDMVVPASGYTSNIGLYQAVAPAYYNLRILNQLPRIKAGLTNPQSEYHQAYLVSAAPVPLGSRNVATSDFTPGHIHTAHCSGNQQLFIDATPTLKNVMIDTNCKINFRQDSSLENVVVWTTHTDVRSVNAPNGLRLGKNDNCHPDNGVKVVTYGGFEVAQDLQIYSSQVIAKGPIQFAAAANGVEGGSFISGVTVDGTSNTTMGTCPNDQGEVFEVDLFRLAG